MTVREYDAERQTPTGWNIDKYQMYLSKVVQEAAKPLNINEDKNTNIETENSRIQRSVEKGRNASFNASSLDFSFKC